MGVAWLLFSSIHVWHFCRVVGNRLYGSRYHDQIVDTLRRSVESCDHLQSFFLMHSMGGGRRGWGGGRRGWGGGRRGWGGVHMRPVWRMLIGTGSGVGTKILEVLKDEYPDVYR